MLSRLACVLFVVGCAEHAEPLGPILDLDADAVDVAVPCGQTANKFLRVSNPGDQELVVDVTTDVEGVTVTPTHLVVPSLESRGSTIILTPKRKDRLTGVVTVSGAGQTGQLGIAIQGQGIGVVFDPPILDFGSVLPHTTKELALTISSDEPAATVGVNLGLPSTPRFEILGTPTARIDASRPTATFNVRYIASDGPQIHTGSMVVESSGSTCVPDVLELRGVTVN